MKIIKKVSVLVLLCACLFIVKKDHITQAQTSCPERDQCYADADTDYRSQLEYADFAYANCTDDANSSRNSCLGQADHFRFLCEANADMEFENNLGRCMAIPDPYDSEFCVQELETIRQNAYSNCAWEVDPMIQGCWNEFYPRDQACTTDYYNYTSSAQNTLANRYGSCDTLC